MILYASDWDKYPNAIVQGNTKNKSWLKCREIFRALDIHNHNWHLQLLDASLLDVDPHDPNLGPVTLAKIMVECYKNPTYLFREVLRVKIKGSDVTDFISADRGFLATLWLYLNFLEF